MFGLPADSFLFGIVALVKEAKNHRLLLRALATLVEALPKVRLIIVGDQGQYSSSYFDLVKGDIDRLSLGRYVTLAGWRTDSFNVIGGLDCMVMPSAWEGFGLVFLEALVQGVPVIGTRVGGIPEVVRHGVDGFLVASNDVRGLCDAMAQMVSDHHRIRSRVESRGPTYVLEHFSLKAMVDRTMDAYAAALGPQGLDGVA
jgi:glycosyltransferase involved in cell wall biosynthesis